MELVRHDNWIAGSWRPAASGIDFEPRGRCDAGERWPRSGAEDVEWAFEAARAAAPEWSATPAVERVERLSRALDELAPPGPAARSPRVNEGRRRAPRDPLATRLGLRSRELAPHRERAIAAARAELEAALDAPPRAPRTALVLARAAELFHGLLERIWPALARGDAVVVLADPGLPELGDELARALDRAELAPGAAAVLHDDGLGALRAALAHPELELLRAAGWREELEGLRAEAARLRGGLGARTAKAAFEAANAPFGAGIAAESVPDRRGSGLEFELRAVRNRSGVVLSSDEVGERAAELARGAFGRVEALGGQLAGQVGRVLCHEAVFSRFTEALLEEVDRVATIGETVPLLDPELPGHVEALRRLGLDEGATLVRGLEEPPVSSRRNGGGTRLCASVFTNAEPRMRLARASRPAPVLTLLRAADDAAAAALASELAAGGARRPEGV